MLIIIIRQYEANSGLGFASQLLYTVPGILARLFRIFIAYKKVFTLYLPITLVCIISLWFGIDAWVVHRYPAPAALSITNVTSTSAAVTFVTPTPMRICGVWVGLAPLPVGISCDWSVSRVHRLSLTSLFPATTYRLVVGYGLRWWGSWVDPVGGKLADKSLPRQAIKPFQTLSRQSTNDMPESELFGELVNEERQPQNGVVVVQTEAGTVFSAQTNAAGGFSVSVPAMVNDDIARLGTVNVSIWTEDGYKVFPLPVSVAVGKKQKIVVVPYE